MSETSPPDFTAFGAIGETISIMRTEFKFFAILISIYVIVSLVPYLFLFDGIDFTDPEMFVNQMQGAQPFLSVLYIAYYLLYAVFIIYILDRTNASLNNYSMDEYPYFSRAVNCAIPVILAYIISVLLTFVGLLLLIIPGLIVFAGLYLAIPAKLAENISFLSAIPRSWELTKGHRLGIWGVFLIPLVPMFIISFGLLSFAVIDVNILFSPVYLAISAIVNSTFAVFFFVASGVVYHQICNENMVDHPTVD